MLKEVIISGFGGQGALLIGQLLAMAGIREDLNATWRPTYGAEKRGGIAYCDVILSDEVIGSPVVEEPEAVIAMDDNSMVMFEEKIVPGGALFYNSSLIKRAQSRTDIKYFPVACNEIAEELGSAKVANMIIFGAYIAYSEVVKMDSVEEALREKMGKNKEKLIPLNRKALERGEEFVK